METPPDIYRLFIAISLPEAVKAELSKAQAELKAALLRGSVRWTKPEQFHVTLKFLGDVPRNQLKALDESLQRACAQLSALELRAERIGGFPNLRYPRVIWASVHDGKEQLPQLQKAIEHAVRPFTEQKAKTKFTGHITLGRCQGIRRPQAEILAQLALRMVDRVFGEWTADKAELIRSELRPGGSRYTILASSHLAKEPSSEKLSSI